MGKYNKTILKFIILFVIIIIGVFAYNSWKNRYSYKLVERQEPKSTMLRSALAYYILETGDEKLTFGGKSTINNIDLLIIKLQQKNVYEGKVYNEYLKNLNYPNKPKSDYYRPYGRTKIVIYKNQEEYENKVYVGPAEDTDIIEFTN
ncbi:MAG: hypothetical protein Q8942_17910 [Bacillota bacterium]|nr:hypothetical protein [Bacillota bacterium]